MRWAALALVVLAMPLATASEPYLTLMDWHSGVALVPTAGIVADVFVFDAPHCYRDLLLDLIYDPAELSANVPHVGSAAVGYQFQVEVWHNGTQIASTTIARSGYGQPLARLDTEGAHELRLALTLGADVDWTARLRGRLMTDIPECASPLD